MYLGFTSFSTMLIIMNTGGKKKHNKINKLYFTLLTTIMLFFYSFMINF